ncbi:hypothetical protein CHUAL_011042 [Chamberlinius hualienensis]
MASDDVRNDLSNEIDGEGDQLQDTVLVTGFGPFSFHEKNPSWEAVTRLKEIGVRNDVKLVTELIPVEYEFVRTTIKNLWNKYCPKLVVHCGVSGVAKDLTLEQIAHNDGYRSLDIRGLLPPENCCCNDGCAPKTLRSAIDMSQVCESVNSSDCRVKSVVSDDPGRYLCDFIYYTSLNIDHTRAAFIHVPPLDRPYSVEQLAIAIKVAILAMLDQVRSIDRAHQCSNGISS